MLPTANGPMILCDSNIIIDVDRGYLPALEWFQESADAIQDRPNKRALEKILKMIGPMPTLWPEPEAAQVALELLTRFHLSHGLRKYDALIAATTLAANVPLYTFDRRHFHFIPDLQIVEPYNKGGATS